MYSHVCFDIVSGIERLDTACRQRVCLVLWLPNIHENRAHFASQPHPTATYFLLDQDVILVHIMPLFRENPIRAGAIGVWCIATKSRIDFKLRVLQVSWFCSLDFMRRS